MEYQEPRPPSPISPHHGPVVYKCSECHDEYPSLDRLEVHLWACHLRAFPFRCSLCNYPCLNAKLMSDHFASCHPETTDSAVEFKRRLDLESRLRALLSQSIHLAVLRCESDGQIYEDEEITDGRSLMVNHLSSLNVEVTPPHCGPIVYKCSECHEEHPSLDRLEVHLWACHLREFAFRCSLCNYPSLNANLMSDHFASCHPDTTDSAVEFKRRLDLESRLRTLLSQPIHPGVLRCESDEQIYEDEEITPGRSLVINHLSSSNIEVISDEVFQEEIVEEYEPEPASSYICEEIDPLDYYNLPENDYDDLYDFLSSTAHTSEHVIYDLESGRALADARPPQKGKKRDPQFRDPHVQLVEVDNSIVEMAAPKLKPLDRVRPTRPPNAATSEPVKPARNLDWIIDAVSKGLDVDSASPHNRRKPVVHTCEFCGKTNKYPSKIEAHMRTHTGERPFVCEICGASFTQKTPLRMHLRRHLNQKPYSCDYPGCEAAFVSGALLNAHKGSKHSTLTKYFACSNQCGKNFKSVRNQQKHENECTYIAPEMEDEFDEYDHGAAEQFL